MKLIIQIPCYNEADSLPQTVAELPRGVPGFEVVEWLVVDDGSTDETARVAKDLGVDYVVRHNHNLGLARAFMTGLESCLEHGADVIVNTDADNQYSAADIPALVRPVLDQRMDIVVGVRPIDRIEHFSTIKKCLQKLGSLVVRLVSNTDIPDAPSGFRAFSRDAARRLVVFNEYTYTLETLIQAGQKNMAMASVPVRVNEQIRPSRLMTGIWSYIRRSVVTIVRVFVIYRPFRFFSFIGLLLFLPGFLLGVRFLWYYFAGDGGGHIQSLILAAVLMIIGFHTVLVAFLADQLAANRKLLEEIRYRTSGQPISKHENG